MIQLTTAYSPIQYGDIDVTHILPADTNGNVPIIIIFVRRSTNNMIYSMKRGLKKTGLSITESSTKRRVELLTEARRVLGLKNVWTMNGDIYGFHNGESITKMGYWRLFGLKAPTRNSEGYQITT
ncbi:uncharacterized protein LOC144432176 [Styela clava]